MGILKKLLGSDKDAQAEEKPVITKDKPDFATRSVSADLQAKFHKEPREFTREDFEQVKEVLVAGIWNDKPQKLYLQELRLFPNLEKIYFKDVKFCSRDMYQIRQLKAERLKHLVFDGCYFEEALRLNDVYDRFELLDCQYKKDCRFWGNYPNLQELVFRSRLGETWDFGFLSKLSKLKFLEVSGVGMKDGSCLEQVASLETLVLYDTNILCQEVLECANLKQVYAWEPLYRELVQAKEEGKNDNLEVFQAQMPVSDQ